MKRILTLITWIALCFFGTVSIQAQEAVPPLDAGAEGVLKVDLVYSSGLKKQPLSQVSLAVVKTASLESSQGAAVYTTLPPFDAEKVDWPGMSTAQSEAAALKMAEIARSKSVSPVIQSTDAAGRAVFASLEPGMYLVYQNAPAGINDRFEEMKPFLVSVPSLKNGRWQYIVEAKPKASLIRKKPTVSRPPSTGIGTWIQVPGIIIMFAALAFILLHQGMKRSQR